MLELFKQNYNEGKVLILVIDSVDRLQDSKQRQNLCSETENLFGRETITRPYKYISFKIKVMYILTPSDVFMYIKRN